MTKGKTKIIIIGSANGRGNCGDELQCEAACHFFRTKLPNFDIVTDSSNMAWQSPIENVRLVQAVLYDNRRRFPDKCHKAIRKPLRFFLLPFALKVPFYDRLIGHGRIFLSELRDASLLFFSGAGGLTDKYPGGILAWRAMILAAEQCGVPIVMSGIGAGPLRSSILRCLLRPALRVPLLITCREHSKTPIILKELGVQDERMVCVPDDALFYNPVEQEMAKEWLSANTDYDSNRPYIAVNLMRSQLGKKNWVHRARLIGKKLQTALPSHQKIYVPLNSEDVPVLSVAAQQDDNAFVVPLMSPGMCKAIMSGAMLAVSCRYHGCVFSLSNGVPTLGIYGESYQEGKNKGVLEMFGMGDYALEAAETETGRFEKRVLQMYDEKEQLTQQIMKVRESLKPKAFFAHKEALNITS